MKQLQDHQRRIYEIEKDIPPPEHKNAIYPFPKMEVGDSFALNGANPKSTISAMSYFIRKNPGKKFTVRQTPDGYRCWRLA